MNPSYEDITSRINEAPAWWQQGGVPRWGQFGPQQAASIYAREVVLMEIACQSCQTLFKVALCDRLLSDEPPLAQQITAGTLHYGDPPNTGCCAAGASMNSEPRAILEYWSTHDQRYVKDGRVTDIEKYFEWTRNPLLEGPYQGWSGKLRPTGQDNKAGQS